MIFGNRNGKAGEKCNRLGSNEYECQVKEKKKVLLVACDVYRPAAINQLGVLAEQLGVEIYKEEGNKNPIEMSPYQRCPFQIP